MVEAVPTKAFLQVDWIQAWIQRRVIAVLSEKGRDAITPAAWKWATQKHLANPMLILSYPAEARICAHYADLVKLTEAVRQTTGICHIVISGSDGVKECKFDASANPKRWIYQSMPSVGLPESLG